MAEGRAEGQATVLVVDDEAMLRDIIREALEAYGYRVLMAGHGDEALRLADGTPAAIDVLLTDVVLPGMSGPDLAAAILKQRSATRVVFMSGHIEAELVHYGVHEPGLNFLQKPFTPAELAAKLREVLA